MSNEEVIYNTIITLLEVYKYMNIKNFEIHKKTIQRCIINLERIVDEEQKEREQ